MPTEYVTVFAIKQSMPDWPFALIGLALILIGVATVIGRKKFGWKQPHWLFAIGSFAFGLLWVLIVFGVVRQEPSSFNELRNGQYQIVEGLVKDFQPMPYQGHQDECFTVQSVQFCYSDYDIGSGFHNTASHGGPIREGLPVRIAYSRGVILRLEVPKDAVLTPAQSAAVTNLNKRQYQASVADDPFEQEMQVAFFVVGFGWVLWWNLQWKRVMQFWVRPPNRTIVQYGFRIFFALNLFGIAAGLIVQLVKHPLGRDQFVPTLKIIGIMGVIVTLMSVFGLWRIERRNRQNQNRTALPQ